jgi:hypothetical protein
VGKSSNFPRGLAHAAAPWVLSDARSARAVLSATSDQNASPPNTTARAPVTIAVICRLAAIKTGFGGLTWLTSSRRLREFESLYTVTFSLAEIVGEPYTVFVDPAGREGAGYRALWEHMHAGQHEQGRFRRMARNGRRAHG